jgi:hypothetical protein
MSKTQKILAAVIISGLCVSIVFSIYSIRTTPRLEKLSIIQGEPYTPNGEYPMAQPIEKKYVTLPIAFPVKVDTSDWKEFKDDKYGLTIKYPDDWKIKTGISTTSLSSGVIVTTNRVQLQKKAHIILIGYNETGNTDILFGGRVIYDISDYISFVINNDNVISRSIIPEQWEGNGQTYLNVCHMQTNIDNKVPKQLASCDSSVRINNVYIGVDFSLDKIDTFDPDILKEMDAILQHISLREN